MAASTRQPEPGWLTQTRRDAWAMYCDFPLPSGTESEDWKYTDLSRFPLDTAPDLTDGPAPLIVDRTADTGWSRGGVIFTDLLAAAHEYQESARERLHSLIPPAQGKLAALHAAKLTGGSFLHVPAGVEVAIPLMSQHLATGSADSIFPHTVIHLGRGASAVYVDEYMGSGREHGLSVAHVEIIMEEGSRLTCFNLQHCNSRIAHFLSQSALLGPGARLTTVTTALGGQHMRGDIRVNLAGRGSRSDLMGLLLGDASQTYDVLTTQDHTAPDTESDLLFKTALKDTARAAYTGLIRIAKNAQRSNAYQQNRTLLMNRGTRSFSTPKLEIEADDVRCTHGSATGSFDGDQVFYLTSRGIPLDDARQLIIRGFFEPVINKIPGEAIQERLWAFLGTKLGTSWDTDTLS